MDWLCGIWIKLFGLYHGDPSLSRMMDCFSMFGNRFWLQTGYTLSGRNLGLRCCFFECLHPVLTVITALHRTLSLPSSFQVMMFISHFLSFQQVHAYTLLLHPPLLLLLLLLLLLTYFLLNPSRKSACMGILMSSAVIHSDVSFWVLYRQNAKNL